MEEQLAWLYEELGRALRLEKWPAATDLSLALARRCSALEHVRVSSGRP